MRRRSTFVILLAAGALALLAATPASANDARTALGANGEVYTVVRGSYGNLFGADAPAGSAANPVLALEVLKAGKDERTLVPGTGGPEDEQDAALAYDTIGSRPYVVWQSQRVFSIVGFAGADGWQQTVELPGDLASTKRNPQLATSVVRYLKLDAEDHPVAARRTIVHLVYHDDAEPDGRLVYTAAAIEDNVVVPAAQAFDLRLLAGDAPTLPNALTAPASLWQRPVARRGRDNDNVGIAFVDDERGELVTVELRPIADDLGHFADAARAVVIEIGHRNPGDSHSKIADKARAVVIEIGRKVMHPVIADFLSKAFLDNLAAADASSTIETAARGAWAHVIGTGITLQQGTGAKPHVVELAGTASDGSSRALDLRWVSRRVLPQLPEASDLKLFLSPRAQEASIAWSAPSAVRYRETAGPGWEPLRSLQLGPTLTREQAFKLVEQRLDEQ
jgi:hypothetical protein